MEVFISFSVIRIGGEETELLSGHITPTGDSITSDHIHNGQVRFTTI